MDNCIIIGCQNLADSHDLCGIHYVIWWTSNGPVVPMRKKKPLSSKGYFATKMPEYKVWQGVRNRCYRSSDIAYQYYGARGIKVCDRWLGKKGFARFISDMGERPSSKHSLDRIDSDGDYTPENCRWATVHQQAGNKRNSTRHAGVRLVKLKTSKYWLATLVVNKKRVLYEKFDTFNEAMVARQEAMKRYGIDL